MEASASSSNEEAHASYHPIGTIRRTHTLFKAFPG
nr:MAG TPA: hypothetical protein [Caudoviricetes sp.]